MFPLSLTGHASIWLTEMSYNSINTWDQLIDVFLARYYLVSKKLDHKDKVNNFVALPEESLISSWDRFTAFVWGIPNQCIDDESLKKHFYRGQDENNKVVLDTNAGGSYGMHIYLDRREVGEHISQQYVLEP